MDPLDAIEAANARWMEAYEDGRLDDLAQAYTEDAESLAPDAHPVVGQAAIREFWESARAGPMKALRLETREVDGLGDTIVEIGESTQIGADGASIGRFDYLVVWKRRRGAWLIHREIWNSAKG